VAAGGIIAASHVNGLYDASKGKPKVRLIQQTAQAIASATDVALTFGAGSTDYDSHGFHSEVTNNTRITPNIPGRYLFRGVFFMAGAGSGLTYILLAAAIFKNGAVQCPRIRSTGPTQTNVASSVELEFELAANGTTDYFEFKGVQVGSTAGTYNTNVGGSFASVFECSYERDL
jgi:hypothetical protein